MHVSHALVAVGLLAVALAGCLGNDPAAEPPGQPAAFFDPMVSGNASHEHWNRAQHAHAFNVSLRGHHALTTQDGDTAQVHSIDLCQHWVVLGRERVGEYGVDIVDVSDPADPQWIGQYRDENAEPGDRDVAWSADCQYVFMANQGLFSLEEETNLETSGIRIINAVDKSNPVFESFYVIPGTIPVPEAGLSASGGVHTVYAQLIGGTQYVYALNYGVHILRMIDGPDGRKTLTLEGRYATVDAERLQTVNDAGPDQVATRRTIYGHDMVVYEEEGRVILYVAYAYDGLRIVDITVPSAPQALAHWVPGGPGAPHYVHSVRSYVASDGRRITVLGSETFEDRNTHTPSPLWVLDTSAIDAPRLLSTWNNPGGHGADHLLFSMHFYEVEDERLWLTHYHGGIWVLDLSEPEEPAVAGFYLPHEDTGYEPPENCCGGWKFAGIPMTFDIKVREGIAYAADFSTGLYVVSLAAS